VQERPLVLATEILVYSAAEIEYAESLRWYADRSLSAAVDFDREFDRALTSILAGPARFPYCDGRHQFYLMQKVPFRIVFRQTDSTIHIVAVAHTSRKPNY